MAEGQLTDAQIRAIVAREIASSLAYDSSSLAKRRRRATEYMRGEMSEWPAEKNRSSVVSRETSDVISWILPGVIRLFAASGQMAICEPVEPGDEQWAKQATLGINHVFWKDNPGYCILYDVTYNSLLHGNGVVKHWWDKTPEEKISFHSGLTDEDLTALTTPEYEETDEDGDPEETIEVLAQTTKRTKVQGQDEQGNPTEEVIALHDVKIKRTKKCGKARLIAVAPEDFLISSEAVTIPGARLKGHKERHTRSELIKMGFDRDKVMAIGRDPTDETDVERRDYDADLDEASQVATEEVYLYELYLKLDVDGDDIAETCRIYYGGLGTAGELLEWEVWEDEEVFTDISCDPVPHRYVGRSVFDKTEDIQEITTVLERQALDNIYGSNNPQRFATGRIHNPDELVNPSFGGTVFGDENATLTPLPLPFFADKAFEAISFFADRLERRTGVSKTTMALDPEALQNTSATASQLQHDAAYSQVELVARNQAEYSGWQAVFRNILKLLVRHQDKPRTIRLQGVPETAPMEQKWATIDPRHWNADMDVTINTGLGTGSRDRDMVHLQGVKNDQVLLATAFREAGDIKKAVGMLPMMIETMKKSAEAAGIRSPEIFYPTYTQEEVDAAVQALSQPQPNPKLEEIAAKAEADKGLKEVDAQVSVHEANLKAEGEIAKNTAELQADLQTKEADRQNAIIIADRQGQIDLEKQARELAFKQWDAEQNRALERERMAHEREQAAHQREMDAYKTNVAVESKRESAAAKAEPA
jgi:hypothetical protein